MHDGLHRHIVCGKPAGNFYLALSKLPSKHVDERCCGWLLGLIGRLMPHGRSSSCRKSSGGHRGGDCSTNASHCYVAKSSREWWSNGHSFAKGRRVAYALGI